MAILAVFTVITAVLSAFLDNVTTVLLIGPMTIAITQILEVNPVPFLFSQILASTWAARPPSSATRPTS